MQQLAIDVPLMRLARAAGDEAAQRCVDKAVRVVDFDPIGAARFIHGWLVAHGPTSGEQLVKQARAHSFRPHDGRAFGPVFKALLRDNKVRVLRSDLPREHGHGTAGGRLYEAVARRGAA